MMFFLIAAPFGTLALLSAVTTPPVSLLGAAALCVGLIGYDVWRGGAVKIFGAATALLLGTLGVWMLMSRTHWSPLSIRITIDCGLLAVALASIAFKFPFTLQYAREQVEPERAILPHFVRTNYVLTWAWAGAFVLMLAADIATIFMPQMPLWIGVVATFLIRSTGMWLTQRYAARRRAALAAQS